MKDLSCIRCAACAPSSRARVKGGTDADVPQRQKDARLRPSWACGIFRASVRPRVASRHLLIRIDFVVSEPIALVSLEAIPLKRATELSHRDVQAVPVSRASATRRYLQVSRLVHCELQSVSQSVVTKTPTCSTELMAHTHTQFWSSFQVCGGYLCIFQCRCIFFFLLEGRRTSGCSSAHFTVNSSPEKGRAEKGTANTLVGFSPSQRVH